METVFGDPLTHESVTVRRTIFVAGTARPSVAEPFVLGPMDSIVNPIVPITNVFVYPPSDDRTPHDGRSSVSSVVSSSSPSFSVIHLEQLHVALSRVLDYYPHLAGRLQVLPNGTRVIKALQTGAGFLEAHCTQTLAALKAARPVLGAPDRLTLFQLPADGNALLAPFEFSSPEALAANPILTVQYTRFACGGVAIGIRVLHTVTDASGFFMFVRHLAEVYRKITAASADGELDLGTIYLDAPPAIDGFNATDSGAVPIDPDALAQLPPLYRAVAKKTEEAAVSEVGTTAAAPPAPTSGRELRFTAKDLDALKARAVDAANTEGWVSTFEALTALLWQRTYVAQYQLYQERLREHAHQPAGTPTPTPPSPSYLTSFDVRRELQGRGVLPLQYFPNALTTPILSLAPETLLSEALGPVATRLHALVRHSVATKGDYWTGVSRWFHTVADKTCFEGDFNGGVMTSQWNKIDMYDGVCFVAGQPPALVATTFTPISLVDGLGYFVPDRQPHVAGAASADEGGLTVYYALSVPVWKLLEKDPAIAPYMVYDVEARVAS